MDINLRMAVGKALGCTPGIETFDSLSYVGQHESVEVPVCQCEDRKHGPTDGEIVPAFLEFYEVDTPAALDALEEFCEKGDDSGKYLYEIHKRPTYYRVVIKYSATGNGISEEAGETLAIAICEAIQVAARWN